MVSQLVVVAPLHTHPIGGDSAAPWRRLCGGDWVRRSSECHSPSGGRESRTAEQRNKEVDSLRDMCTNAMHTCAMIMASQFTGNLTAVIAEVADPIRTHFGQMIVQLETRKVSVRYFSSMARGGWHGELIERTAALSNPPALESIRLEVFGDGEEGKSIQDQRLNEFMELCVHLGGATWQGFLEWALPALKPT